MKREQVAAVLERYKPLGIVRGRQFGAELLLRPQDALRLADELGKLGVPIAGVDGWKYVNREHGTVRQDIDVDFSVDDALLRQHDAVERSVALVKDFIRHQLLPDTDFVVLNLDIPQGWDVLGVP